MRYILAFPVCIKAVNLVAEIAWHPSSSSLIDEIIHRACDHLEDLICTLEAVKVVDCHKREPNTTEK